MTQRSKFIRDLKWVIASPSLLDLSNPLVAGPEILAATEGSTDGIDERELHSFLSVQRVHRVGRYFERLVQFQLENICGFEMIAIGEAIRDGKTTLGEVDFVYRDHAGIATHLETAVKFYLFLPEQNATGSHLIGPNSSDNFEKKTRRMFEHQLPLSKYAFPEVQRRIALVKGRIFYPANRAGLAATSQWLSPDHLRGSWLHYRDLNDWRCDDTQFRYRIQRKPHWLASDQSRGQATGLLTRDELAGLANERFASEYRPLLVSILKRHDDHFSETDRLFIVSDSWPETPNR